MSDARLAWEGGTVAAAWHGEPGDTLLALTHGAGGTYDTPSLVAYAEAMAGRGLQVVRFNLPYVEAGKKTPGPQARDERCWRDVALGLRPHARRLLLGGRSYGGRMATHVVADGLACEGLVLLAYPWHPPGKPERPRTAHLERIMAPMLFLQGTRDPFADPAVVTRALAQLPGATRHRLEGGDHGHTVAGRSIAGVVAELADATVQWLDAQVGR
ncbi:MAG: alpha/beta hydrolase [Deltaproteobacteria bacterium]|nr:alpha/beta hydrolase [Deltaproteobacteria bacterium]